MQLSTKGYTGCGSQLLLLLSAWLCCCLVDSLTCPLTNGNC